VAHFESRRVLPSALPSVVHARRGNVGMAKPLLHFGNVCLVLERVGRSGGTHHMNTARYSQFSGVGAHNLVNAIGGKRAIELTSTIVTNRSEERKSHPEPWSRAALGSLSRSVRSLAACNTSGLGFSVASCKWIAIDIHCQAEGWRVAHGAFDCFVGTEAGFHQGDPRSPFSEEGGQPVGRDACIQGPGGRNHG
jgi:hypothetical protein